MITAFRNVDLLSMKDDRIARDQTMLVEGETILAIGPSDQLEIPAGATVIEAKGKTLIPGLFDMHTHIVPHVVMPREHEDAVESSLNMAGEYLGLFLAHGVTTIRNQSGSTFLMQVREAAHAGRWPSPKINLSGPTVEQVFLPRIATYHTRVADPAAGAAEIHRQADVGFDCIKIYNSISKEVFYALVAAAKERGIRIGGHIPIPVGLIAALEAGLDCVEHLRGFDALLDTRPMYQRKPAFPRDNYSGWRHTTTARITELADRVAAFGTSHAPTMTVEDPAHSEIHYPQAVVEAMPWSVRQHLEGLRNEIQVNAGERAALDATQAARREMLKALDDRDVSLFTASDCPGASTRLIPGYSLLEEIVTFVKAGISPYRALRAATVMPAAYLRMDDRGTLEPGKRADMVLLDADPLADITAIHSRTGTMVGGVWYKTGPTRYADDILSWRNAPGINVANAKTSVGEVQWGKQTAMPPLTKAAPITARLS